VLLSLNLNKYPLYYIIIIVIITIIITATENFCDTGLISLVQLSLITITAL